MQDLDEAREARKNADRVVRIGGSEFTIRSSVRPEVMVEWDAVGVESDDADVIRIMDELIVNLIEDKAQAATWKSLRAREEDAISSGDMFAFVRAAVGIVTGRPTQPPSPSTSGETSTADSSTAGTPSTPEGT